ncbi:hypothetical protein FB451DRAFT_1498137 [Mycena latifolia]|nr:hypothetical protein FB451DRAFT_1498137 [Mycena latifolia]
MNGSIWEYWTAEHYLDFDEDNTEAPARSNTGRRLSRCRITSRSPAETKRGCAGDATKHAARDDPVHRERLWNLLCGARGRCSRSAREGRARVIKHGRPSRSRSAPGSPVANRRTRRNTPEHARAQEAARPEHDAGRGATSPHKRVQARRVGEQRAAPSPTSRCAHASGVTATLLATQSPPATRDAPAKNPEYEALRSHQHEPQPDVAARGRKLKVSALELCSEESRMGGTRHLRGERRDPVTRTREDEGAGAGAGPALSAAYELVAQATGGMRDVGRLRVEELSVARAVVTSCADAPERADKGPRCVAQGERNVPDSLGTRCSGHGILRAHEYKPRARECMVASLHEVLRWRWYCGLRPEHAARTPTRPDRAARGHPPTAFVTARARRQIICAALIHAEACASVAGLRPQGSRSLSPTFLSTKSEMARSWSAISADNAQRSDTHVRGLGDVVLSVTMEGMSPRIIRCALKHAARDIGGGWGALARCSGARAWSTRATARIRARRGWADAR